MDEEELIARAWTVFRRDPAELLGLDDAQAIDVQGTLVLNVDVFDESTDWLPGMTLRVVGWRAVVAGVSDVLVKGGKPLGILLAVGMPEELVDASHDLFVGVEEACRELGVRVWGGDLGASETLYVSVTAVGVARRLISRRGARPGDVLMAAGHEVLTPVAYALLLRGAKPCEGAEEAVQAAFRPKLVKPDFWLNVLEDVTASIDDSDGLALTLHRLAEASGVRLVVEALPLSRALVECAGEWGLDPLELALYGGGEEYTFIFTVKRGRESEVLSRAERHGVKAWRIGRVEE
ncbi:MAG: hypothetical protein DRK00_10490, partial [Thermoprotei archaeon]